MPHLMIEVSVCLGLIINSEMSAGGVTTDADDNNPYFVYTEIMQTEILDLASS